MPPPVTHPAPVAAMVAGGLLVAAAALQYALTLRDRHRYPPPGRMVEVGGHRLHLDVRGSGPGRPTVVLEAGLGSFSPNWHWVQEALSEHVRTVSYDRAGLGWSDPGPGPRDAFTIAAELRLALRNAGIAGPFVLVGHSYGGLPVRAFAELHPEDTAGLVLADTSHPDQWVRWPTPHADRILAWSQRLAAVLACFGVVRALDLSATLSRGLPPLQVAQLRARFALPRCPLTEAAQMQGWPSSRRQLAAARPLGDLPVALVGVGRQPRGGALLTQLQEELTLISTNTGRRIVTEATHEALVARPEFAVAVTDAVRAVLDAAAGASRTPGERRSLGEF